jgi:hypothetical protein
MSQIYSDPTRESDPHALPDVETFHVGINETPDGADGLLLGWYWWSCFPGCMPDGDPIGPFNTEAEAVLDAQNL